MNVELLLTIEEKIDRGACYTVTEVAAICKKSRQTIYNWHRGARVRSLGIIHLPFCGSTERSEALVQGTDLIRFLMKFYSGSESDGEALTIMLRCPHCGRVVKSA
jgi:hypothetical protein